MKKHCLFWSYYINSFFLEDWCQYSKICNSSFFCFCFSIHFLYKIEDEFICKWLKLISIIISYQTKESNVIYRNMNQFSLVFILYIWFNLFFIEVKQPYTIQIDITAVQFLSSILFITHLCYSIVFFFYHPVNDLSLNGDCSFSRSLSASIGHHVCHQHHRCANVYSYTICIYKCRVYIYIYID